MSNITSKVNNSINNSKISPYLNNYGQVIIEEKIDEKILKEFSIKIKELAIKNNDNYDENFINLIIKKDIGQIFNYIELFNAIKNRDTAQALKYLQFRYMFGKASNEKINLGYPPYLLIEPVSTCNFRCPMCFQIDKSFTRKPYMGIMKWDLFTKIVDEANEIGTGAITLASRGEPTLHPKLAEMFEYISKKKNIFEIKLNTNASFLNEKICNAIYESNLTTVVVSGDHYKKEEYEKLRKNSNFEEIIKKIELLNKIRKNFPESTTEIRISGVDYYKNLNREKFKKFWKPYCDNVSVAAAVERWDTYNNKPELDNLSPCSFLWDRMYVWFDGKCNPCDADYKSYLSYGDASKEDLKQIWNGKKINNLRKLHLEKNRTKVVPCDRCGMAFN